MYVSFDRFLQNAITEYYDRAGRRQRGDFVALLIASGELAPLAMDRVKRASPSEFAGAAATAVALRVGLRFALSGPLAILVSGLTLASLTSYLFRQQGEVFAKVGPFRQAVADARQAYERVQDGHADGKYDDDDRKLMIDGLTQRLMKDLVAASETPTTTPVTTPEAQAAPEAAAVEEGSE